MEQLLIILLKKIILQRFNIYMNYKDENFIKVLDKLDSVYTLYGLDMIEYINEI